MSDCNCELEPTIPITRHVNPHCAIHGEDQEARQWREYATRQKVERDQFLAHAESLAQALRDLRAAIQLGTLNVRKDFSLMVAHASATKALVAWEGAQQ